MDGAQFYFFPSFLSSFVIFRINWQGAFIAIRPNTSKIIIKQSPLTSLVFYCPMGMNTSALMEMMSVNKKARNAPLYLNTTAKCDLTKFPIIIKLATPKALFNALNVKRIETKKVIVEFEEEE
jgi:hypothetical protein